MLDDVLNNAEAFDAKIVRFQQPERGVCMSLVITWVKYQALGKDFWADSKKGNKFIQTPHIRIFNRAYVADDYGPEGPRVTTQRQETAKRVLSDRYLQKHHARQLGLEQAGAAKRAAFDSGKGPKYSPEDAMVEEVQKSKELSRTHQVQGEPTSKAKPVKEIDSAFDPLTSLQGVILKLLAYDPKDVFLSAHYVAAYFSSDNKSRFFDPNMGEAVFKTRQDFLDWFENYKRAWPKIASYKDIKKFLAKPFKAAMRLDVDPFADFM